MKHIKINKSSVFFILALLVFVLSSAVIVGNAFAESEALTVFKRYFSEIRDCANYDEYERVTKKYACSDMVKQLDSPQAKALPKEFKEQLFAMLKSQFFDMEELVILDEDIQGNQACIKYSRRDDAHLKGTATLIKERNIWKIKKVSEGASSN